MHCHLDRSFAHPKLNRKSRIRLRFPIANQARFQAFKHLRFVVMFERNAQSPEDRIEQGYRPFPLELLFERRFGCRFVAVALFSSVELFYVDNASPLLRVVLAPLLRTKMVART